MMQTESSSEDKSKTCTEEGDTDSKLTEIQLWQKILSKKEECVEIQKKILHISHVVKKSKAIMKESAAKNLSLSAPLIEQQTVSLSSKSVEPDFNGKSNGSQSYMVEPEIYIESSSPVGNYLQNKTFSPSFSSFSDCSGSSNSFESPGDDTRETTAYYKAPLLLRSVTGPLPNSIRPPLLPTPPYNSDRHKERQRNMPRGSCSSPHPNCDFPFDPSQPPHQPQQLNGWPQSQTDQQVPINRPYPSPSSFQMPVQHHGQNFNLPIQQPQQQHHNFHFMNQSPPSRMPFQPQQHHHRPPHPLKYQNNFQQQNRFHYGQNQRSRYPPSRSMMPNQIRMGSPGPRTQFPSPNHSIPRFPRNNLHHLPPSWSPQQQHQSRPTWRRKMTMNERHPGPRRVPITTTTSTTYNNNNVPVAPAKNENPTESMETTICVPNSKPKNHSSSKINNKNAPSTSSKRNKSNIEQNQVKTWYEVAGTADVRKSFDVYFHSPEFKSRTRFTTLIESILLGNRCHFCGLRYICSVQESKEYSQHLDMHFQQNRSLKQINNLRVPLSRSWYLSANDWISNVEAKEFIRLSGNMWKNVAQSGGIKRPSSLVQSRDDVKKIKSKCSVPAFEKNRDCPLCEEVFETYFDEDFEEWRFKNSALCDDGRAFHVVCLNEYKEAEENDASQFQADQ